MLKALGFVCVAVGGSLLGYVGGTYIRGEVARGQAIAVWEDAEAKGAVAAVHKAVAWRPRGPAALGAPVARIEIPAISLDEIVLEGVGDDELNAAPGHLPGSVLPGERGNAVISAHRDRHFHGLATVQVGDTIVTQTVQERTPWVVVSRRVVGKDAPALFATREPTLTLTTCWPVSYVGTAPDRLLITAAPIWPKHAG
ncbi:MAG: hypothetical protein NVS1B4_22200 [Gemmatimonadaceae bacterium]